MNTYTKRQLAEMKRKGGIWLAKEIKSDVNWNGGKYTKLLHARYRAAVDVNTMTVRQVYDFLKKNGYTFDAAHALWNYEAQS